MNLVKVNCCKVNCKEFSYYEEYCMFVGRCLYKFLMGCKQFLKFVDWVGFKFFGFFG